MATAGAILIALPAFGQASELPVSSLRVRDGKTWVTWWTSNPVSGTRETRPLASRLQWRDEKNGVFWGELVLSGDGEAWRTRLIVARIDPTRVRLSLDTAFANQRAAWSVERMAEKSDRDVVLAVNAGQFVETLPWGWVVLEGKQMLGAQNGPLSSALVIDSAGKVSWRHGDAVASGGAAGAVWAFQSYPTLLRRGQVPDALRSSNNGVDAAHRDARLAIGELANGELVLAMTRFDGLGEAFGVLPLGLTTPEMAAVMESLGARDAVMLDGGISAQLLIRNRAGEANLWRALRAVPLALVARRR